MRWHLSEFTPDLAPQWDDFVTQHTQGSVHQLTAWRTLQAQIPGRQVVRGFLLRQSDTQQIIGVTWCVRMSTGVGQSFWWYSPRGPVITPHLHPEATSVFLDLIAQQLRPSGAAHWRIDPYWSASDWAQFSTSASWQPAIQQYQPTDSLHLDLTQSDPDLLKGMKRKGRYNIKLAHKKGVTCQTIPASEVTDTQLSTFFQLMTATTDRDGFAGSPQAYYRWFLDSLAPHAALFFAHAPDGTPIASAISTVACGKAIYYFGASTSDSSYRPLMAPYALQWHMIQWAKSHHAQSYDFLGIAPDGQPHHPYAGISQFKWKFGGHRVTYAPAQTTVFRPLLYRAYTSAKWLRDRLRGK